jgi:hypothetical protein
MSVKPLQVSLAGPDLQDLFRRVEASHELFSGAVTFLSVDDQAREVSLDWLERWLPRCRRNVFARHGESFESFLDYSKDHVVKASAPAADYNAARILKWLEGLPFSVASFGAIYSAWDFRDNFPGPSFADLHFPLGWACAFQGLGHRRLVSRRWLEFGPWRLIRGRNDTSLVQFHDLNADSDTAFAQARPGHERMGISDSGGFLQSNYVYTYPVEGIYETEQRRLKILIHGRPVSQLEMTDACAARVNQALGPDRPLNSIAYVFADPDEAAAHLKELWLRELECWTFTQGREVRIDVDYSPPNDRPEWAHPVEP